MKKQQFQKLYTVVTGVCILTAALCLMGSCGYLFFCQGEFTRENVAEVFVCISLPVYLALGMAVLGFFLDILQPQKARKLTAPRQEWLILKRLRSRVALTTCDAGVRDQILRERRKQCFYQAVSTAMAIMVPVSLLVYLLTDDRFLREDINGSVLGLLGVLAPGLAMNLAWSLISGLKHAESRRREIALLKPLASSGTGPSGKSLAIPRLAVLILAVGLLVWGFSSGGAADVLTKAINICTECIGLG